MKKPCLAKAFQGFLTIGIESNYYFIVIEKKSGKVAFRKRGKVTRFLVPLSTIYIINLSSYFNKLSSLIQNSPN